ncbi:Uncharacterized protein Fot_36505 [Forsythia ovata]|uniref:Uncharacterized protein n=1 Tax=Forsythia ovata TaxID=205694 RepID=A0ABD1SSI1_9LAMI
MENLQSAKVTGESESREERRKYSFDLNLETTKEMNVDSLNLASTKSQSTPVGRCRADEGRKHVERVEIPTYRGDKVKYVERKLIDKGVQKKERHPADGLPLKDDPKKGLEKEAAPPAIDEKDPNYVEEGLEGEERK